MIFNSLVNHYHPEKNKELFQLLPAEEMQKVKINGHQWSSLDPLIHKKSQLLDFLHYSWILPVIESFSPSMKILALASLTQEQLNGIKKSSSVFLSPPVKAFVQERLYQQLNLNEPLPFGYLPQSEFSMLLEWKKGKLVELVDFLGLHDLASEVKHVLDKNSLKNIYTTLNPKQFHFLKTCLNQKEKIVSPKLGLDLTKIDKEQLHHLLHQRGLARFAKALYGQPQEFIWYLAHRFDSGRGKILLKQHKIEPIPKITVALKQQVVELMNFLNNE